MNRNRFLQLAALATLAAALPLRAADEALPKGEAVLERFIEATGGRKAYEKHTSETTTMAMEFVGKGIKGTGTRYVDSTNNSLETMSLDNIGKIDQGVFNGVAWETNPMTGPRLADGAEKALRLRTAKFNAPLHWRELFSSAETTGMEAVDGDPCYKVVLTPKEGKPETGWYSKKTGLLVKMSQVITTQMGEFPVEMFAKNYKTFDGISMPTEMQQEMMGNQIVITVSDVKFNTAIPKSQFEPPADVKKLMAK